MLVKTVKVSAKGQVTLPADALRAMNIRKGSEFVLIQRGDTIVLVPSEKAGEQLIDEFGGWATLAEPAFRDLWDNEEDEIWNEA